MVPLLVSIHRVAVVRASPLPPPPTLHAPATHNPIVILVVVHM